MNMMTNGGVGGNIDGDSNDSGGGTGLDGGSVVDSGGVGSDGSGCRGGGDGVGGYRGGDQ